MEGMDFSGLLNAYMKRLKCTSAELVAYSGVSAATVSRYRAGIRTPSPDSTQFRAIAAGLARAAAEIGRPEMDEALFRRELLAALRAEKPFDPAVLRINLNMLIDRMHLNAKKMALAMGMDYSAFFRIRSGQRQPSDPRGFCDLAAKYVFSRVGDDITRDILSDVLNCASADLERETEACAQIADWLLTGAQKQRQYVRDFLLELDKFDLDRYIANFDRTDANAGAYAAQNARGMEEAFIRSLPPREQGEIAYICTDFFSDALLSPEYITAMLIRSGFRVRLILNADHPLDALLRQLESLMPVFLSGRLEAFYLKGRRDAVYKTRLISLQHAAVRAECICGNEGSARAETVYDEDDVRYCRARAEQIFRCAVPLIEVIDRDEKKRAAVLREDKQRQGKRFSVLSTPPVYTVDDALLDRILQRNGIYGTDADKIRQYIASERARVLRLLRHTEITDRVPAITQAEYDEKPVFLSLSGMFFDREILCTYDEYIAHMELTRAFERAHSAYRCIADENVMCRNVQIFLNVGFWIMLSKNRTPAIHLFIRHPKLRRSFENMLLLYGSDENNHKPL